MGITQFSIVLIDLGETIGSEINKTRPCVVISPNEINKQLNTIIILPLTTNLHPYPTRVAVYHNKKKGMVAIDQIRTIDKRRLINIVGVLSPKEQENCRNKIKEIFL